MEWTLHSNDMIDPQLGLFRTGVDTWTRSTDGNLQRRSKFGIESLSLLRMHYVGGLTGSRLHDRDGILQLAGSPSQMGEFFTGAVTTIRCEYGLTSTR